MGIRTNKSGFVFIMSVFLACFLGILLEAAFLRTQLQLQQSKLRLASQKAWDAAETGLEDAVYKLRQSPQWRPGTNGDPALVNVPVLIAANDPTTVVGTYNLTIQDINDNNSIYNEVWIKSTGQSIAGQDFDQPITRAILAKVILENPASFFVLTAGDLHITSGSQFSNDILAKDVYFNVNSAFPAETVHLNGNVYYLDNIYGVPNSQVTISGQTSKYPDITFTGIDLNRYEQLANAEGNYYQGDLSINGPDIDDKDLNTSNGVVYATGNITVSGTIKDSMLLVAGGNIYIQGNITADPSQNPAPQLGLMAGGDVIIPQSAPANLTVQAFVMADGEAKGSQGGVFMAEGAPSSKGTLNFSGSMALRGDGARTAADLNAYQTRDYEYNSALQTDRLIPFLPFIANIISWQELQDPTTPIPK